LKEKVDFKKHGKEVGAGGHSSLGKQEGEYTKERFRTLAEFVQEQGRKCLQQRYQLTPDQLPPPVSFVSDGTNTSVAGVSLAVQGGCPSNAIESRGLRRSLRHFTETVQNATTARVVATEMLRNAGDAGREMIETEEAVQAVEELRAVEELSSSSEDLGGGVDVMRT
jgi:hypothetical protein